MKLKWMGAWRGHSCHRYRKDVDGFLKVNMVRFETVEVTKEIMKNMAKKPQSLRKSQRTSGRNKRTEAAAESGRSSPAGSSSPSSSSSSSYSSELSGAEDGSSQPSPRGSDSPVYCVMSTIPHIEEEPGALMHEDCDGSGTSGAVQALTEVARGLGMDVVWTQQPLCNETAFSHYFDATGAVSAPWFYSTHVIFCTFYSSCDASAKLCDMLISRLLSLKHYRAMSI